MPICKNCGEQLSSIDKDICPFCGQIKPFDLSKKEKTDTTQVLKFDVEESENVEFRSKKTLLLLSFLLGFLAAHYLYLKEKRSFLILLCCSLITFIGLSLILSLAVFHNAIGILVAFALPVLINLFYGFYYFNNKNIKDKNNVSVR